MEKMPDFTWWIASGGDEWVASAAEEPGGKRRSPSYPVVVPIGSDFEAYQPPPQLFVEFCRLDILADDAITKFANRYGALGRMVFFFRRADARGTE